MIDIKTFQYYNSHNANSFYLCISEFKEWYVITSSLGNFLLQIGQIYKINLAYDSTWLTTGLAGAILISGFFVYYCFSHFFSSNSAFFLI